MAPLAAALRSRRGKDGFPDWPDCCYVPAWYVERHIVAEGRASFPLERAYDPMILAALCAWRMGKGIYRFDPDLLQELWETPVTGEIAGEILLRLPEWCVYLELPGHALGKDMPIQGCFAFIDWEPRFARAELCLIADTPEHGLLPAAPIVLGGSIEEGMRAAMGDYMGSPLRSVHPGFQRMRSRSSRRRPPGQPNRSYRCASTLAVASFGSGVLRASRFCPLALCRDSDRFFLT
jgi:hypothetical protein